MATASALCVRAAAFEVWTSEQARDFGGAFGGDEVRRIDNGNGTYDFVHIYTNVASATLEVPAKSGIIANTLKMLVVGGGGGGGADCGGGGGAGGLIYLTDLALPAGTVQLTVGAGGATVAKANNVAGKNGSPSEVTLDGTTYTANGGGGGGCYDATGGQAGGSGGGGFNSRAAGLSNQAAPGVGNNGGAGVSGASIGAGGGGAGGVGGSVNGNNAGAGGAGLQFDISGEAKWYAAGGGGGAQGGAYGAGGSGVGGRGGKNQSGYYSGVEGTPGTGSGGGGACGGVSQGQKGAGGGSGVVILRYTVTEPAVIVSGGITSDVDGDAVYIFTNATSAGTFKLNGYAQVWALAVGGGGAGANPAAATVRQGGAGGGGAGGFMENQALLLAPGTYTVNVGAGGVPGAAATQAAGADGGNSELVLNGTVVYSAVGGGGGGIKSAGRTGGSGGGGSYSGDGGAGTEGQGNKGGKGTNYAAGGGGGGAGSVGAATGGVGIGGNGGDGRASTITGESVIYAAGGGGGSRTATGGTGGSGIGGNGGGSAGSATAGKDGTGSGGGGGKQSDVGGAGGSGIVIIRVRFIMPDKPQSQTFVYDGEEHLIYEGSKAYTIKDAMGTVVGQISVKNVGTHTFTVTPNTGYCWSDGTSAAVTCTITVTKPKLIVNSLTLEGWQLGEQPNEVQIESVPTLDKSEYTVVYSTTGTSGWTTTVPTTAGNYYVTAKIPASANFSAPDSIPVSQFSIWAWSEDDKTVAGLGYHATITVAGYTGTQPLVDFPMLVHLTENSPTGFHYKHANADGSDLRFIDAEGNQLPFEIDTWDVTGESLVWVKIPTYQNGTKITMCWGELADKVVPAAPVSTKVWDAYALVVHGGTTLKDATKNNLKLTVGSSAVSGAAEGGAAGGGISKSSANSIGLNVVNPSNAGALLSTTNFTLSGWFKPGQISDNKTAILLANNPALSDNGFAWCVSQMNTLDLTGSNQHGYDTAKTLGTTWVKDGAWAHFATSYASTEFVHYWNGDTLSSGTTPFASINPRTGNVWTIGGYANTANGGNFAGMMDEIRVYNGTASADWIKAEYEQIGGAGYTFGPTLIAPNSCFKNRWLVPPTASKWVWAEGKEGCTVTQGVAVYGEPYYVFEKSSGETFTNSVPTAAGEYILWGYADAGKDPQGTRSWAFLEINAGTIAITVSSPYTNLSGTSGNMTLSGRVLLANNDACGENAITDQDYDQVYSATVANGTYWIHEQESAVGTLPKLRQGTYHTLSHLGAIDELCGATNIWRLENVRIGNTYPRAVEEYASFPERNYLPWSDTSGDQAKSAHIVMRNIEDACIYSPCYTNGIGTIYFDAVNGWTSEDGEYYKLVVEICTNLTYNPVMIPTDENVLKITPAHDEEEVLDPDAGTTITNHIEAVTETYGYANWQPVEVLPLLCKGAEMSSLPETSELALMMNDGGTYQNFYRVCVKLNVNVPVRFRIRRVSATPASMYGIDEGGLILIDNVIVSYPAMRADLSSYGWYDEAKGGKQTLGQEIAWNVPFPSINDSITVRAKPEYTVNVGDQTADTNKFVTTAKMNYRWRYLDQSDTGWKSIGLDPTANFVSAAALDLPQGQPGDVEYWFELRLNAPFYDYVDYSGSGLGLGDLYTENIGVVTNRSTAVESFDSQGTDWFVRLREGKSDYEALNLLVRKFEADGTEWATTNVVEMELIDDHVWRGYFQTLDPVEGGIKFQIQMLNQQTPGAVDWNASTNIFYCRDDATSLPVSGTMIAGSEESWTAMPCDATTGYLLFQIDDQTRSITVVHADYQNFNTWNDANKAVGGQAVFVGSSTEDDGKAGASPRAIECGEDFNDWLNMPATNVHWQEDFTTTVAQEYGDYITFPSTTTPNGWNAGQGMWVYGKFKDVKTGRALQMEGQGRGYLQFIDAAEAPRGLESISFNARLGQFTGFNDFCYYDADAKMSMSNYTFLTRAAFDTSSNSGFSGNASLSMVAYYRPGKGCYEFRVEQALATTDQTSYLPRGQVFSLYRWTYGSNGSLSATLLGCQTNSAHFNRTDWPKTSGLAGKYQVLFFSVENSPTGTCLVAGFRNDATGTLPSAAITDLSNKKYNAICYRDNSAVQLKAGTYGLVSANCNGVFMEPFQLKSPVAQCAKITKVNTIDRFSDNTFLFDTTDARSCRADIADDWWVIPPGRMTVFDTSSTSWGLQAVAPTQKLNIYTGTSGKTDWKLLASTNFNSFGSTTKPCVFNLYTTKDCSVKIAAAGTVDDLRTDLVLDDVILRQWRGDDYSDVNEMVNYIPNWTDPTNYKAHTNFIFTSSWITNQALLLSAKRTAPGTPCSIRSPLFDGSYGRGKGLGMFSFRYLNAQENVNLLLQIATNVSYDVVNNINNLDAMTWTTVTNFNFQGMSVADRASGTRSCYVGLHDVKGVMRLVMDPAVVNAVSNQMDVAKFGEIFIDEVYCRDEPALNAGCWWGWNIRTLGKSETTGKDAEKRMYLPDCTSILAKEGMSLALNNSVTKDVKDTDGETYLQHQPFVQTPTFTSNIVGEVTFRARKYDSLKTSQPAQVTLYGSLTGDENGDWRRLTYFIVSNNTFTTYTFKTEPGESYNAFRLGVSGVADVIDTHMPNYSPEGYDAPVRVLLDEVLVSEAVRARVAFRNVGAFRGVAPASMNGTTFVPDVPSEKEQPLCNESWGVQCEVYAAQLPDEIDFSRNPRVRLYWYEGDYPWGFENWKTNKNCKSAYLARATDTNLVYRSSYLTAQDAVIPMSTAPGQVVQYSLEVEYYQVGASTPMTNVLSQADWATPSWYKPVDLNRDNGGIYFSAYNILDTVAPHWAWINEVNLFGAYDYNYDNTDKDYQFVEVAVPAEADITGWSVRMLEAQKGTDSVITNTLGIFGNADLEPMKPNLIGMASNMVFRVLANQGAKTKGNLKVADGTLDGVWKIDYPTTLVSASGEISAIDPLALQLVRASGIVEHEIVTMGTNWWSDLEYYNAQYHPTNTVNYLNAHMRDANFLYVGDDDGGLAESRGVVNERGGTTNVWNNTMVRTPGRINEGQNIDPDHPTPNGSSILVYCNLATDPGHISQTVGDFVNTNGNVILVVQKGLQRGTNITYRVDPWYALGTVTTNGKAAASTEIDKRVYTVNVAANASNNVTVVASARVNDELLNLGLTDDNRYRPAVLDWLSKGETLRGPFADPDADEVKLADFMTLAGNVMTNMTLTQMYWLDMDPTVGNLALKAGMSEPAGPNVVPGFEGKASTTNLRMRVFMQITNRTEDASSPHYAEAWTPYVLRGLEPGVTSKDYELSSEWAWTSVTFKVTGILANGLTSEKNGKNWIPLRWFIFHEDSFNQPGEENPFTAQIEVKDPYGTETPGYSAGWYDWVQEHGYTPVFFSWWLDERLKPFNVEVLKKTNLYE